MKIRDIGEFGFIAYLRRKLTLQKKNCDNRRIILGIGDDAFVGKLNKNRCLVATTDAMVEDVHFRIRWSTWAQVGHKIVAINLSDLAAMGNVKPLFALVSLGVPRNFSYHNLTRFYDGLSKTAEQYGLQLVGGDTVRADKFFVSLTLIGEGKQTELVSRSTAQPGDLIFVTGCLGDSAAGLDVLETNYPTKKGYAKNLVDKHLYPVPRLKEGKILAKNKLANSMIDCSDGLDSSLKFICSQSNVSAEIWVDKIHISSSLRRWTLDTGRYLYKYVLFGGEDYELVFTVPEKKLKKLNQIYPQLNPIGKVGSGKGIRYYYQKKRVDFRGQGYDAFKT